MANASANTTRIPRNLVLVFVGQLASTLGDFLFAVALMAIIYQQTESALAVGYLTIVQSAPNFVLAPFAGVWVDRLNPKRVMVISDLARSILVLGLLLDHSVTAIYVVTGLLACVSVFFDPARSSFMPRAFERQALLRGNSLISTGKSLVRVAGPALGAFLMARYGLAPAVWFNAASFVVSALCISQVPFASNRAAPARHGTKFWTELNEGFRYVISVPLVRRLITVGVMALLGIAPVSVLLVAFAQGQLGMTPATVGYLISAEGIGALTAGVSIGVLSKRMSPRHLMAVGLSLVGLSMAVLARASSMVTALVAVGLAGAGMVASNVAVETGLQMVVEQKVLGRVFSLTMTAFMCTQLLTAGSAGWLADRVGVRTVFVGAAAMLILTAFVGWLGLREQAGKEMKSDASGNDRPEEGRVAAI